jgi:integrase
LPKPWLVVIRVHGQRRSRSFPSRAAAVKYQTKLNQAVMQGEEFDPATGEPDSWNRTPTLQPRVPDIALAIVADKWPDLRATSRRTMVEGLAHVIAATAGRDRQRVYSLACRALVPNPDLSVRDMSLWRSVTATSPVAATLNYETVRADLAVNLDGTMAGATTRTKRNQALGQVIAKATGHYPTAETTRTTRTSTTHKVSPAVVGTSLEVLSIINLIPFEGVRRALLLMFYAGLRPSEAIALRWEYVSDADITVAENTPVAGARYTDGEDRADIQPPKWRTDGASRRVPIVEPLRALLDQWRSEDGGSGLVCRNSDGNRMVTNDLSNGWRPVRAQVGANWPKSRLSTPYTLRHTHASIALNAGVPVPELAARLGHSPQELLRTYAAVITLHEQRWTDVMSQAFE